MFHNEKITLGENVVNISPMLTAASGKPLIGASYSCPLPPVFNLILVYLKIRLLTVRPTKNTSR